MEGGGETEIMSIDYTNYGNSTTYFTIPPYRKVYNMW